MAPKAPDSVRQLPGMPHSRREIGKEMEDARARSRRSRQCSPRYSNPMPRDIAHPPLCLPQATSLAFAGRPPPWGQTPGKKKKGSFEVGVQADGTGTASGQLAQKHGA